MPINTWTHVAVIFDGANEIHYVNGVRVESSGCGGLLDVNDQDFKIGSRGGDGGNGSDFNGLIDEAYLYGRALTDDEVASIYTAGTVGRAANALGGASNPAGSCQAIKVADGAAPSGAYWLDPDGAGNAAVAPFVAFCDQQTAGGGWELVGKLGNNTGHNLVGPLTSDRGTGSLANGNPPGATEFSTWNMSRFNAYGSTWTAMVAVDSRNDGGHLQYTFYRPGAGQVVSPQTVGSNWKNTATPSKLVNLVRSTNVGANNTTWIATPDWDLGTNLVLFGYRRGNLGNQCLDGSFQTIQCHAPAGTLTDEGGLTGSMTAAFGNNDGIGHTWSRRATYWLKNVNQNGAP